MELHPITFQTPFFLIKPNIMIKDIITEMMIGSDTNKTVYQNLLLLVNEISKLKNYSNNETTSFEKKIRSLKKEIDKLLDEPKDYLKYQNGTSSKDNSPGYNSEQYLKIILNNDRNKIIIIDQPEDNLGNRFITTELVKEIRNIKFQKQLFLITHNPSIVVYGDAESIIIAHNDNNSIKYKQVVLEDKNAQKEICEILDGGEYIFDKRAKKYNIQRLIQEEE
jgi:predicted metallo-beta-lactamase superfamily hydrolase